MAPTSDEVLAQEYLRFLSTKLRWDPHLHPRGPDGRFLDVPGFVQALGDEPAGEPGPGIVRRAVEQPALRIRDELARLRTRARVQTFVGAELSRITGRDVPVDLGERIHVTTMREVAEGLLRSAENWPQTRLERVSVQPRLPGGAPDAWSTSFTGPNGGRAIVLNERQLTNRTRFLARLRRTVESGDNRPTSDNAAYVAAHEFGHVVVHQQIDARGSEQRVNLTMAAIEHLRDQRITVDDPKAMDAYISGQLGTHVLNSPQEMAAEAFADVILNDENASPMSLVINTAARRGMRDPNFITPAPPPPPVSSPTAPVGRPAPRRASVRLRIAEALTRWANGHGDDDPLTGFDREPLRLVARDYGIQLRRGAAVDEIRSALIDHTRTTVHDRRTATQEVRSLADMLDNPLSTSNEQVQAVFDGKFGDLRTQTTKVSLANNSLFVSGDIYDNSGRHVGNIDQDYYRDHRGKLIAHHGLMELNARVQGSGFATAFGGHLLQWYQQSGVDELHTLADIDVGGYTWARSGFNFADTSNARRIIDRLDDVVSRLETDPGSRLRLNAPNIEEQIKLGRQLVAKAVLARVVDDYPTAYEISQLGRWDGAGKDDTWIGKLILLGSSWEAVLKL